MQDKHPRVLPSGRQPQPYDASFANKLCATINRLLLALIILPKGKP